jgi:hypothetical protein
MATVNELLEETKCFFCYGLTQAELLELGLLLRIVAAGGGSTQVITDSFADPNGNVTPDDPTAGALYYEDSDTLQLWRWSVIQQLWIATITT